MPQLLIVLGAVLAVVGVAIIGAGAPSWVLGLGLGSSLIESGTIAFVGGLILIGLALVLRTLNELLRQVDVLASLTLDRAAPTAPQPQTGVAQLAPELAAYAPQAATGEASAPSRNDGAAMLTDQAQPETGEHSPVPEEPARARRNETAPPVGEPGQSRREAAPAPAPEAPPRVRRESAPEAPQRAPRGDMPELPREVPMRFRRDRASERRVADAGPPRRDVPFTFAADEAARAREEQAPELPRNHEPSRDVPRSEPPPRGRRESLPPPADDGWPGRASLQEGGAPQRETSSEPEIVTQRNPNDAEIVRSGIIGSMAYTLYSDGSIEAELPMGTVRFNSLTELQEHVMRTGAEADKEFSGRSQ